MFQTGTVAIAQVSTFPTKELLSGPVPSTRPAVEILVLSAPAEIVA